MLVKDWMSTGVMSIDADDSIQRAIQLQKTHGASILPVMEKGKLVGIITDRDIKRASAPDVMPIDIDEAIYLTTKIKARQVMTPHPFTVSFEQTVEEAAEMLLKNKISGAPVVDNNGHIVGIINRSDILRTMMCCTGSDRMGYQIAFSVKDLPGSTREIINLVRNRKGRVATILSTSKHVKTPGYRNVFLRIHDIDPEEIPPLLEEIKEKARLLYIVDFFLNKREIFDKNESHLEHF